MECKELIVDTLDNLNAGQFEDLKTVLVASPLFIESVQDLGIFDMSLNSEETDCLYRSFYEQVKGLRLEVEDNQLLIITIDDPAMLDMYSDRIKDETQEEIESALDKAGLSPSDYMKEIRVAVA